MENSYVFGYGMGFYMLNLTSPRQSVTDSKVGPDKVWLLVTDTTAGPDKVWLLVTDV